jgi:3-oxoacyl-[acyl-carrier-protein] synthase-3
MKARGTTIGLRGYGIFVPEAREGAEQIGARTGLTADAVRNELGLTSRPVPRDEDQPVPMAVEAARRALAAAELSPSEVDVVLWTGEEHKDYPAQTASIRVQEEVGARAAWAFDLIGQGVTSLLGIRVARALMVGDPTVKTVLLAGGTRNIDLVDQSAESTRWLVPSSASGTAMVLCRDYGSNVIRGIAGIVDSALADDVYVPAGGTVHPWSRENLGTSQMFFQSIRPAVVRDYVADTMPRKLVEVVRAAMAEAGSAGSAPDYLALRHLMPRGRAIVVDALGLRQDQCDPLEDLGHHGPGDVVLSLDRGLGRGAIRDGATVALASAGIGFNYAAAVLRWGPAEAVAR